MNKKIFKPSLSDLTSIIFLCCCVLITAFKGTWVMANIHLSPPHFLFEGKKSVYVDFERADYEIVYDFKKRIVYAYSKIYFKQFESGYPLIDLIPHAEEVKINGQKTFLETLNTPNGTVLKRLNQSLEKGEHILEIKNRIKKYVRFKKVGKGVSQAFWIRDLKARKFLEQYIPSNFEYDQYEMNLYLKFKGIKKPRHDIYTNGKVTQLDSHSYHIQFPPYYTVSCPYFHITPKGAKKRLDFTYQSIDGRNIPVTVYTSWWSRPQKFKMESLKIFQELEKDYGPWPHESFTAYETFPGTGGMEHAGATQTSLGALDHEMLHSYFAKGVMPANGNSGWIDEAIASWRDYGYQSKEVPGFLESNLGRGSVYQRRTDSRAYFLGREFLAYIDYNLRFRGGLKSFLKGYFKAYKHTVITQEHFKNNLEFFSGLNFDDDFNQYIWSDKSKKTSRQHPDELNHPVHKEITEHDLMKLL